MSDNNMTARWAEARKNALKMAGITYADDATSDDLQALCKQHGLKVTLGSDKPSEVDDLKAQLAAMKAAQDAQITALKDALDRAIGQGLTSPVTGLGGEAEKMASIIARAVKEELRPEVDKDGFVDPKYIDKDDRMEKEELFFSWRHWNLISFSMKYGVAERPPMGPIEFTAESGRWVRQGNDDVAHYVCVAKVWSRKQARWLREHEHFGISFFDNTRDLNTSHGEQWARTAQKWATSLASKKPQELLRLAAQNNIGTNIDEDPEDLRRRLIGKLTEGEMEVMEQLAERTARRGSELVETVGSL